MTVTSKIVAALLVLVISPAARAQSTFYYPAPAPGTVTTAKDVPYGTSGAVKLAMDVYRPSKATGRVPALIFFNQSVGAQRSAFTFYVRWAETAAMNGLVAIVPDLRSESAAADFQILITHLTSRAADYGLDPDAIAVYAGSGNVFAALPVVQDPALTVVKAAVMYYGTANVKSFRLDLPILMVRAGLDRPALNAAMATLASAAVVQNAPVTVLNHPTGPHGFEATSNDAMTRGVIDQTIDFVKRATSPPYQAALHAGVQEATAAGHVSAGNFKAAAAVYAKLVEVRPDDARLRLSYGESLLADAQFATACAEFEKLKGKGLGPRDLGLPAARACAQMGDADRAVEWIRSIPSRFLPAEVQKDAALASLHGRADFQASIQEVRSSNSAARPADNPRREGDV